MQSTGHSSIHALSLMSTQGWAIVYVTYVSSTFRSFACHGLLLASPRRSPAVQQGFRLLILDVAHTRQLHGTHSRITWRQASRWRPRLLSPALPRRCCAIAQPERLYRAIAVRVGCDQRHRAADLHIVTFAAKSPNNGAIK